MSRWYKLVDKKPVQVTDAEEIGRCFLEDRVVKRTELDNWVVVSTVFLWLDHSFTPDSEPVLFETMIFWWHYDNYQKRYCTWEEAEKWHIITLRLATEWSIITYFKKILALIWN